MPDSLNVQNDLLSRLTQQQQEMLYTQLLISKELSRRSGATLPAALTYKYESLADSIEKLSENKTENIQQSIADGKSATNWSAVFAPSEFVKGASDVIITVGKTVTGPAGQLSGKFIEKAYDITTGIVEVTNNIEAGNDAAAHGNEVGANKDYSSASAGIVDTVSKIGEASEVADPGHVFKQLGFLGNSMALVNAYNENDYHAIAKEYTSLLGKVTSLADEATGSLISDANTIAQGGFKMRDGLEKIQEGAEFWKQQHKQIDEQGNAVSDFNSKAVENMNANRYEVFKYRQMLELGNDPETDNLLNALTVRNPHFLQNDMQQKIGAQQDVVVDRVFHYAAASPLKMPEEELNAFKSGNIIPESKMPFNNTNVVNKGNFSPGFQDTGKPDTIKPLADPNLVNLANNAGAIQQFIDANNYTHAQDVLAAKNTTQGTVVNSSADQNQIHAGQKPILADPFHGQKVSGRDSNSKPKPAEGQDPNLAKNTETEITEGRYITDEEGNGADNSLSEISDKINKLLADKDKPSYEPELKSHTYEDRSVYYSSTYSDEDLDTNEYSPWGKSDAGNSENYSSQPNQNQNNINQQPKDAVDEMYDNFKKYVSNILDKPAETTVSYGNNLHGPSLNDISTDKYSTNIYDTQSQKNIEEMQRQIQRLQNMSGGNLNYSGSSLNGSGSAYYPDDNDNTSSNELADGGY